jgi:hypothetical protein
MAAATLRFSTISFQKWNGANFASTGEGDHKNQVAEDGEDEGVEDRRTSRAPGQMPT